jgi:5-methylcytosine-specific restriction endonuclease McrA
VLLLNATYEPLQVVTWQRAMILWFQEKVDILESHTVYIRSVRQNYSAPAVLRLRYYIKPRRYRRVRLCRENIFLRDSYQCQYCAQTFPYKDLTLDHVMPVSRGGPKSWQNLVTACHKCNHKKGSQTPEEAHMPLLNPPKPLKWTPQLDMKVKIQQTEEAWSPYLIHSFL